MKCDKWKTNEIIEMIIILKVHIIIHYIYHFDSSEISFKIYLKYFQRLCIETIEIIWLFYVD